MAVKKVNKVVLAYSGGLDTSVIIPWLKETYGCRVIAYIADVGQGDDYAALKKKAVKSGADKVVVDDLKKQFIETFCYPMLKSGALYENRYLMGTSIARPIIAAGQVACAKREKADAVSHGATGKGNDQVRFELTYMMLAPKLTVIAAWKDPNWTIKSREDAIRYAKKHKIPVPVSKKKPYSIDQNIWHTSYEGGVLENPWNTPIKGMHDTVAPLEKTPAKGQTVTLQFKQGIPVAVDGKQMGAVALLTKLNKLAGKHGVGRVDMVENRLVGIKSRGVYDTPGGTVLYAAHRELEQLVLDRDTLHFKDQVALRYGELVYNGQWFCDLREAIDAFISQTQRYVTGTVRLTLYKGSCIPAGKKSPYSRYSMDLATFEEDDIYDQKDATGFIKLFGLPMKKSHGTK